MTIFFHFQSFRPKAIKESRRENIFLNFSLLKLSRLEWNSSLMSLYDNKLATRPWRLNEVVMVQNIKNSSCWYKQAITSQWCFLMSYSSINLFVLVKLERWECCISFFVCYQTNSFFLRQKLWLSWSSSEIKGKSQYENWFWKSEKAKKKNCR